MKLDFLHLSRPSLCTALTVLLIGLSACNYAIVEAVNEADYYLVNDSSYDLTIQASRELLTNSVLAGETAFFFAMVEGTGGHTLPSNAFSEFRLLAEVSSVQTTAYSGVNNDDWLELPAIEGGNPRLELRVNNETLDLP